VLFCGSKLLNLQIPATFTRNKFTSWPAPPQVEQVGKLLVQQFKLPFNHVRRKTILIENGAGRSAKAVTCRA